MTTLADAAFDLAFDGWAVFPLHEPIPTGCSCRKPDCDSPCKHPRTQRGVLDATIDIPTVKAWWDRWPTANIGLACGVKVDVFDVDDARGLDPAILHAAIDLEGPMALTPGGGAHFYGAPSVSSNRAKFVAGADWRGRNGYVVAAPSRDHRGGWVWSEGCGPTVAIPDWPEIILRALAPKPAPPRPVSTHELVARPEKTLEGLLRFVLESPEGERNQRFYWAICRAGEHIGAGRLDRRAEDVLVDAALRIGLGAHEVEATAKSGLAKAGVA